MPIVSLVGEDRNIKMQFLSDVTLNYFIIQLTVWLAMCSVTCLNPCAHKSFSCFSIEALVSMTGDQRHYQMGNV